MDNEKDLQVIVNQEEIETLNELGFEDEDGLLIKETSDSLVCVDKESGTVAVVANEDGIAVGGLGVVAELVANGIAETKSIDSSEIKDVIDTLEYNASDELTINNEE